MAEWSPSSRRSFAMTFETPRPAKPASHDSETPANLVAFMLQSWKVTTPKIKTLKTATFHAARRAALARRFPGELLVIPTGERKVRANDQFYPFRPGSDFFYLT